MANPREKALRQFPSMYVTLVSVIQAIALETLVSRVGELGLSPSLSWESALVWLEVGLLGQTVFYVWISYTLLVTIAQWVFRFSDFAAVFAVGVFQFTAISWIGADSIEPFMMIAAVGFLAGAWITWSNTGAAQTRPENARIMQALPRRLVVTLLAMVGLLGLLVGVPGQSGSMGTIRYVLILIAANAIFFFALLCWFYWWRRVVGATDWFPESSPGGAETSDS